MTTTTGTTTRSYGITQRSTLHHIDICMASSPPNTQNVGAVQSYRMHVSQRYLDLTRQKLELTRLPREPRFLQGSADYGVSKPELEPLVDHWLEKYDWRKEEADLNAALPQFRVAVNGTKVHCVHKKATSTRAMPLLFIHGWPESFMSITKMIDALCEPVRTPPRGDETTMAFHVVSPSIPGFGFSEALSEEGNNLQMTADMLDALMRMLGYNAYLVHGSGWGLRIARAIALRHPQNIIAIHTVNPDVPPPRPGLSYNPDDIALNELTIQQPQSPTYSHPESPGRRQIRSERPQTLAFALADSPTGLLAYVLDLIQPPSPPTGHQSPLHRGQRNTGFAVLQNPWTPSAIITWTMMYWLPGPEIALRWLSNSKEFTSMLWTAYSNVIVGISHFQPPTSAASSPQLGSGGASPVALPSASWLDAYHNVVMMRRREGRVRFPAWERPAELVLDIRELADVALRQRQQ